MNGLRHAATDLPVIHTAAFARLDHEASRFELSLAHGAILAALFIASIGIAEAQSAGGHASTTSIGRTGLIRARRDSCSPSSRKTSCSSMALPSRS